VSSQLVKRPKLGPKIATKEWWIEQIITHVERGVPESEREHYLGYWTHISPYEIGTFRALAAYDYEVLGTNLRGAPDYGQEDLAEYPPRIDYKPHWFPEVPEFTFTDYKVWTWLRSVRHQDLPRSIQATSWLHYFSIQPNKIQAVKILDIFRINKDHPELNSEAQAQLEATHWSTPPISSIIFDIPQGYPYSTLNNTLEDTRPIPITEDNLVIHKDFIKIYLEERLKEYLALGGHLELIFQIRALGSGIVRKFPKPFYWDLWENLDNLREAYAEYCAENIYFDPAATQDSDQGE